MKDILKDYIKIYKIISTSLPVFKDEADIILNIILSQIDSIYINFINTYIVYPEYKNIVNYLNYTEKDYEIVIKHIISYF